jgi:hypothetical protein
VFSFQCASAGNWTLDVFQIGMAFQSFEDLEVWKRSCRLAVEVNKALLGSNHYVLKDQMARSAISIPSNIAEGHERDSQGDFIWFLRLRRDRLPSFARNVISLSNWRFCPRRTVTGSSRNAVNCPPCFRG